MKAQPLFPVFTATPAAGLRRRGLRGPVSVRLVDAGLELRGEISGGLRISAREVVRLRAGVERLYKGGPYAEVRLWLLAGGAPVTLTVTPPMQAEYVAVMGEFAAAVLAAVPLVDLETGLSARRAWWIGGMLSLPLLLAALFVAFGLPDAPLWQWAALLALPLALCGFGLWSAWANRARPLAGLAAFQAALRGQAE